MNYCVILGQVDQRSAELREECARLVGRGTVEVAAWMNAHSRERRSNGALHRELVLDLRVARDGVVRQGQ